MHAIKNEINKAYRGVVEKITGDLSESAFVSKGMLTPDEFVIAGDALVLKCPTWSWETGKESKINKSLPEDKQFLVIREVPCRIRAKDLLDEEKNHIEEKEDDDGWIIAEPKNKTEIVDFDNEEKKEEVKKEEVDDEIEDIEDMLGSSDDEDENIFAKKQTSQQDNEEEKNEVVNCRRYNISLTYDKYYATPRLWLQGYDEKKKPLEKEMFEDVMAEHAKKTVTLEKHTHLEGPKQATIHP